MPVAPSFEIVVRQRLDQLFVEQVNVRRMLEEVLDKLRVIMEKFETGLGRAGLE